MHKSRLAGFIIDCNTDDLSAAALFWGAVLGAPARESSGAADNPYIELQMPSEDPYVEVQAVDHTSRIHIDIETDDIEAEVKRLQSLGATRVRAVKDWVVMEAPTGQRFCVVKVCSNDFSSRANRWDK